MYTSNNVVIYIFDCRWLDIDMIFPTLCWQSDGSTVWLITDMYSSLWIILVAVCMLIPETPITQCRVSDKFTPWKILLCCVSSELHPPLWYNKLNKISNQRWKLKHLVFQDEKLRRWGTLITIFFLSALRGLCYGWLTSANMFVFE